METIRERLEEDLRTAVTRLRQMGGAVAVEEMPGAIGVHGHDVTGDRE